MPRVSPEEFRHDVPVTAVAVANLLRLATSSPVRSLAELTPSSPATSRTPPSPGQIEVVPPAAFALHNVTLDPSRARRAIDGIVRRSGSSGRSPRTFDGILEVLELRYARTEAVAYLRS